MVNLIVSHDGSQFQRKATQYSRLPSRKASHHQSSHTSPVIESLSFVRPRTTNSSGPTTTTSSGYKGNFPIPSFSSNAPSQGDVGGYMTTVRGGVGGYRTNHTNFESMNYKHELTRDYDSCVTNLYELLESSQWEAAIARCFKFPEEVRTWIVRFVVDDTGYHQNDSTKMQHDVKHHDTAVASSKASQKTLRWRVLPLHSALIFNAPPMVILTMLRIYPIAASKQDDQGMLPLHLAFRHKTDEGVLQRLLEVHPAGIYKEDRRGRIPIDHAGAAFFSGRFVHLYSQAAFSGVERLQVLEERDPISDAKVASTEKMYEQQINDLESHHEEKIGRLQVPDEERNRKNNRSDSRGSSSHLVVEVQLLRSSLERATVESKEMSEMLKHSKHNEKKLENMFQAVLKDQQALHRLCMKQKHQLEHAERIKKQVLHSMLNSERDESALRIAAEISQMSSNLVVSAGCILTHVASKREQGDKRNPIALLEPQESIAPDSQDNDTYWMRSIAKHGDEISGITESSQL